jgi:hypothetical protein
MAARSSLQEGRKDGGPSRGDKAAVLAGLRSKKVTVLTKAEDCATRATWGRVTRLPAGRRGTAVVEVRIAMDGHCRFG